MDSTRELVKSLERFLSRAPSTTCVDEFRVLEVRIGLLSEALAVLKRMLEDERNGIITYDRAVVKVGPASYDRVNIPHVVRRDEADIILTHDTLDEELLCDEHARAYEQALQDPEKQFDFDPWQRYFLLQDIGNCPDCDVKTWVEITLDKNHIENQFRERLAADLPQFASKLDELRVCFWADLDNLYSMIEDKPLQTHKTVAKWGKPCLLICFKNADNDGSDYFRSISTAMCLQREAIEPVLHRLLIAPPLQPLTRSRQSRIQEYPEDVGYLPPEYWLNAQVLAQVHTEEPMPEWFLKVRPFFVYSMLATVSSKVSIGENKKGNKLRFEIERELALSLEWSLDSAKTTVRPTQEELLRNLLRFYSVALQAKFTAVNHDLVQRSVVYGAGFVFDSFFSKLDRIVRFYEFEYKHLLGDRFEQQSRTLSTFIADTMGLRQRLASLVDSLSKDLSGLTIAVLATTALAIVARILNIETWDNLLMYGIVTTPIFAYLYITVFLLRIDNLKDLGGRAVDEFGRDMKLGEQIWDFPLHTIGVGEEELKREKLLKPLLDQHRVNQWIAEIAGLFSHILFMALAVGKNLWWVPVPKLILDSIFLGWSFWSRTRKQNRVKYYSLIWFVTLVFATIVYWVNRR